MYDKEACIRQKEQCLTIANSTDNVHVKEHFMEMAAIWDGLSQQGNGSQKFQEALERILFVSFPTKNK